MSEPHSLDTLESVSIERICHAMDAVAEEDTRDRDGRAAPAASADATAQRLYGRERINRGGETRWYGSGGPHPLFRGAGFAYLRTRDRPRNGSRPACHYRGGGQWCASHQYGWLCHL